MKKKYESFLDDEDTTDKDGLKDAIYYMKDEKQSYINKGKTLQKKREELAKKQKNYLRINKMN